MAIISTVDFDGYGEGAEVANGTIFGSWSSIGIGSTFTALAAAATHGARGIRLTNAGNYRQIQYAETTSAVRVLDFYFNITSIGANTYLASMLDSGTVGGNWRVEPSGRVALRDGSVAVAFSSINLTFGVTYRASWRISAPTQELRIYEGESSTPLITLSGDLTSASRTHITAGLTAAAASSTFDMDTIRLGDDWMDPFDPGEEPPPPPPDDALATLDFDSIPDSTVLSGSLGGDWSTTGGTANFTALSAAAIHGDRGIRLSDGESYRQIAYAESTTATRVLDFYFNLDNVGANSYLASLLDGATNRANWRVQTNGLVALRNGFTAVATSVVALSFGTTYRAAWMFSTTGQELRIYEGDATTPLFTLSGALTSNAHDNIVVGLTATASGTTFDMDTIRIGDDWLDPYDPDTTPPPPGGPDDPLVTRNFDSLTEGQGVDFVDGNWASEGVNSTFTALADAAVHGTRGLRLNNTGNYRRIAYNETASTTRVIDFYFRITAITANLYLATMLDGATTRGNWRVNPDRTVSLRDGSVVTTTSTKVLALNTVYRAAWSVGPGKQVLRIYEGDYEIPLFEIQGTLASSSRTKIAVGLTAASASAGLDLDTVRTATTWLAPYATAGLPPALYTLDFESYEDGDALALTSPWARNGTPPFLAEADAKIHGDMGARLTNSSGYSQLEFNETSSATRVFDLFLTLRAVSNAFFCGAIFNGSSVMATWRVNVDRTISLRDHNNVVVATSAQALLLDQPYRVAWKVTAAGTQELRVFNGSGTALLFSLSASAGSGQRTAWRFGVTGASAGNTIDVDSIRVGADWLDPQGGNSIPIDSNPFIIDLTDGHKMGVTSLTGVAPPPPPRNLAHIGDSLTADQLGATPTVAASYQAEGWSTVHVDGEIGRPIVGTVSGTSMQSVVDGWRAGGINPRDWVVALGSNNVGASDASWINWIGQALYHISIYTDPSGEYGPEVGDYNVYWPGIVFRDDVNDSRATRFWNVLQGIVPPQGINFIPLDLNTALHAGTTAGDWQAGDASGRHMTTAGYAKRNTILAGLVGSPLPL